MQPRGYQRLQGITLVTRGCKELLYITELELSGLPINIARFSYLLKRVDHLALIHIIKSKAQLGTTRIKRLLELISSYSFNLYYIKGKGMILSDFLCRQKHNNSDPHEIIPISFNMLNVLHDRYYNTGNLEKLSSTDTFSGKI